MAYRRCPACRTLNRSCDKCKLSRKLSQEKRNKRLIDAGLCTICQNPSITTRCDICKERQKTKLRTNPCIDCKAERGTKDFLIGKNLCKECGNIRNKKLRKSIPKELWTKRHKNYMEANFNNWLRCNLLNCHFRHQRAKTSSDFSLKLTDVLELLQRQNFRCAISGLQLTHKVHDLSAASIDRIDSNGIYELDNVQLVCKAINLAKNTHTNDEIKNFINLIRNTI